jgi:hypothetical protein
MSKFLLRLTPALALVEPVVQDGKFIGQRLIQHVAALEGIHAALEVVTSGEKVFEIWDLRKRLDTLKHPADVTQNAGYVVLSDYEKDALIKGVKAVDWTFRGTVNVWVRWPQFFDDLRNIVEFDEKNPPVDYLEDKKRFEAALEAHTAQIKALEEAKLAALKEGTDKILAAKLAELQAAGKLGPAATIDDLAKDIVDAAKAEAQKLLDNPPAPVPAPGPQAEVSAPADATGTQEAPPADVSAPSKAFDTTNATEA